LGLCLALRAFEQGGIFIVPHLLWQRALVFQFHPKDCPHRVAYYDTQGDAEDRLLPGSSQVSYSRW
jgi:hypothetical protein